MSPDINSLIMAHEQAFEHLDPPLKLTPVPSQNIFIVDRKPHVSVVLLGANPSFRLLLCLFLPH